MLATTPDDKNACIDVIVSGRSYKLPWRCLVKFERSIFFDALRQHQEIWQDKSDCPEKNMLIINGNPRYFELIAEYLRDPSQLPILKDVSQLQWLEREGNRYNLLELVILIIVIRLGLIIIIMLVQIIMVKMY